MDADLKEKWVDALRSGEYVQAAGYLRLGDGYCCLGVLCDVVDKEMWTDERGTHRWRGESTVLSPEMLQEFEIKQEEMDVLIGMNDESDSNFKTIADYIEERL